MKPSRMNTRVESSGVYFRCVLVCGRNGQRCRAISLAASEPSRCKASQTALIASASMLPCAPTQESPLLANRPFGAPAIDVVLIVAEVVQDFVGVLTELGRERPDRSGRVRKLDRNPDLLDLLAGGRLDLDDHVARANLRIVLDFVERQHPAHADVVLGQHLPPF